LFIGELDTGKRGRFGEKLDDNTTLLMKEQTKSRLITYHINEPYDIAAIKIYEEEVRRGNAVSPMISK
jgi:hypothetical protein